MIHLTASQIAQYQTGDLPPAELLAADDHLAVCDACRELLQRAPIAEVLAQLGSPHLTYEQLEAAVDLNHAPAHLEVCPDCRAEFEDLRAFRASLRKPRPNYTIYAAIAAVLVAGVFLARRGPAYPPEVVRQLETGQIAMPQALAELRRPAGEQRAGTPDEAVFRLLSPQGQAVTAKSLVFRWQPVAGAKSYTVTIFHRDYRERLSQSGLTATEWTPTTALEPNEIFLWTVKAQTAGGEVTAPAPTAPEALFRILPFEPKSNDPLLRANEYLNAGLVAEARAEFAAYQVAHPNDAKAARLRAAMETLAQYPTPRTEKPAQ